MSESKQDRKFDVIVYGATGFTGKLVAEYLLEQYGVDGSLRWAIAGRSATKLTAVRDDLGDGAVDLESLVADSFDDAALASLAAQTRVVLSTVGPYSLYGSKLVAACVDAGTDYCDLAGEAHWIRAMIDTHQARAEETGARIVHCCGFDSIPSDIGVWFLQDAAKARHNEYCQSVGTYVKAAKGTLSGGTMASMMNAIQMARNDRSVLKILGHPYSLNPEGEREGPDGRDQQKVVHDELADAWTAPFIMAGINTKVVRRSNALAGYRYGRDFRYHESTFAGTGIGGWIKGTLITLGLGALVLGLSIGPIRKLLQKFVLPAPGEGPSRKMQEEGYFNLMQIGRLADGSVVRTRVTGDQDPGYGSTRKMLSESAVCLAKDNLDTAGGIWTPASAMGGALLKRLRENAGLTFDVVD